MEYVVLPTREYAINNGKLTTSKLAVLRTLSILEIQHGTPREIRRIRAKTVCTVNEIVASFKAEHPKR
jgi:hypothetical protein